jgi:polyhydroxybutyrate depolymerase
MSNAARRDAPPGSYGANHADRTLAPFNRATTPSVQLSTAMRVHSPSVSRVVSGSSAAIGGGRPHPLAALAFAVIAGALAVEAVPRGHGPAPAAEERLLVHGGRQRTYLVRDFGAGEPGPVVIVLHGGGGNAANAIRMTGFDRLAARERFVAVYPDGTAAHPGVRLLTWNAGHCCAAAMDAGVDDVGFIAAIVDGLVASKRADPARIYVTGMSNGAMLAHRIGRELSPRIAAIAPVVGAVFGDEPAPLAPMPAFIVAGADDAIVPPAGGPLTLRPLLGRRQAADREVAPAMAQATYWARHNGCGEPVRTETAAYTQSTWGHCRSGAPVTFVSVTGNGHAWPGGEPGRAGAAPPSQGYDATEAMWAFFRTQQRRR